MLSNSVFYVPSDVKITLNNPKKILGNIQFDSLSTTFFLDTTVANHVKKNANLTLHSITFIRGVGI